MPINGRKPISQCMIPITNITGRLGNQMFQTAFLYSQVKDKLIPDIYVQSPEHFSNCDKEIKALFSQNARPIDQVAIHVRRGDYVNNPFYVDLSETTYYDDAIKQFPNSRFLVFSDDVKFCKQFFQGDEFEFSEGNSDVEDMTLMQGCKGHIIANSSFSWWGAYSSPYTKKVVAPKAWYADGIERTTCPDNWIRI